MNMGTDIESAASSLARGVTGKQAKFLDKFINKMVEASREANRTGAEQHVRVSGKETLVIISLAEHMKPEGGQ